MAILRPFIAALLIARAVPTARRTSALVGVAAYGVVPPHRVLDDRAENAAHVRVQAMALGELERMLTFERIRRVVTFEQVVGIVEQHADVGAAVDVDQAKQRAGAHGQRPVLAALDAARRR